MTEVMKGGTGAPSLSHIRNSSLANIIAVQHFTPFPPVIRKCVVYLTTKKKKFNIMSFNCEDGPLVPVHCFVVFGSERGAGLCARAGSRWGVDGMA